jgi:polar amino acid transport system permease protein
MSPLFRSDLFIEQLTSAQLGAAAWTTLWISIAALAVGTVGGLILALLQESSYAALRGFVRAYLWLFRGTPALLQIIFAFNVLPSFGLVLSGPACAVLALGLNEAAYLAEIMRSGIRAVSPGQRLAAKALGLEEWQVRVWIVLPQATRIIIPPVGNQFIGMLKVSALVSVIGVHDLLMVAEQAASGTFRYLETLSAAAIWYLAFTTMFMAGQHWLERRLARRRRPVLRTKTQPLYATAAEASR